MSDHAWRNSKRRRVPRLQRLRRSLCKVIQAISCGIFQRQEVIIVYIDSDNDMDEDASVISRHLYIDKGNMSKSSPLLDKNVFRPRYTPEAARCDAGSIPECSAEEVVSRPFILALSRHRLLVKPRGGCRLSPVGMEWIEK